MREADAGRSADPTRRDENAIAELASTQLGLATTAQLRDAGFDHAAIMRRVRSGRLHRVIHGVYLVGHAVAPQYAMELAAVLAYGEGTVVSHRSAARILELRPFREWLDPIEVTVAGRDFRGKRGIRAYRTRSLFRADTIQVHGIPVTTPARTLLDLAAILPLHDLEIVHANAEASHLLKPGDLAAQLERSRGRRGAHNLRRLVELEKSHGMTRSEAERKLLGLLRAADLPRPRSNARVGRFEVDFLWPEQRVVVEVDGYAFHSDRDAFERDRERDAGLAALGCVAVRVTWRQLATRPEAVMARIAGVLAVREPRYER